VIVDGDHVALEAQPPHVPGRRTRRQVRPAGPFDDDLGVRRLLGGLRSIPPSVASTGVSCSARIKQGGVRAGEPDR